MDDNTSRPGENSILPEPDDFADLTVDVYLDESEPSLPPQPIPPKHLAYLLEVRRLLEEREQRRREAARNRQNDAGC